MNLEEEMRAAQATLLVEARELLEEMESGLLELERGGQTQDTVNSIFRAAHTIKGSAGLFGLEPIVAFTHVLETLLDRVRDGAVPVTPELVSVLLPCKDHISTMIDAVANGSDDVSSAQQAIGDRLITELEQFSGDSPPAHPIPAAETVAAPSIPAEPIAADPLGRILHLSLRFGADCLRSGMDPLSFIRYLGGLGDVLQVSTIDAFLPEADEFDPESTYLAFAVTLRTSSDISEIDAVFDFVRDESDIRILPHGSSAADFDDLIESFDPFQSLIQAVLDDTGALAASSPAPDRTDEEAPPGADASPVSPAAPPTAAPPTPGLVATSNGAATGSGTGSVPARSDNSEARTIRVDAARLDRLIDTVGELVIAGAGASLGALGNGNEALRTAISEVTRLIEDVRDDALRLRMVPIGTTLSRFQRVVRDVSASLGKDVALVVNGGETEVDKALVEHIGDPLMHLVRNALDHGFESPDQRVALGKPRRGTLELRARHDSGSILVEIIDDGAGINSAAVAAKAVERGLIDANAPLSDKEIYALIFEPGFSTASTISALSGRGVGMDVVKRNVSALRGTIDIDSRAGAGTTVRIRLPLTLAIIDGFMVGVGATTFIVPLSQVMECVELPATGRGRDYMDLRGEVLPLIPLRRLLHVEGAVPRRENVVVVEYAGTKAGLVVDSLKGEFQTVIKPLGPLFADVAGIGGSTILGDGEVALIIDVPMLVQHAATATIPPRVESVELTHS